MDSKSKFSLINLPADLVSLLVFYFLLFLVAVWLHVFMGLFDLQRPFLKTTASALDSPWVSFPLSEALSSYKKTRAIVKTIGGAKLAWAESKAEVRVSKRPNWDELYTSCNWPICFGCGEGRRSTNLFEQYLWWKHFGYWKNQDLQAVCVLIRRWVWVSGLGNWF